MLFRLLPWLQSLQNAVAVAALTFLGRFEVRNTARHERARAR
jgi:hypothetical protein